ncbi:MAG: polyprenyl diphosphate synthase [Candidatus Paceibacterota bacterium]
MDGNRRWTGKSGVKSIEGHSEGYKKLKEVLGWVKEAGVNDAIVYAFSTENWRRTKEEVGALIGLLSFALSNEVESLVNQGVRLKFIGDLSMFPEDLQTAMKWAEKETSFNGPLTLTVALSYGGRAEILRAIKHVSLLPKEEILSLNEESLKDYLWTAKTPDPDLIIRTGGEIRLSNFLSYQGVYSELFFTKTLWPDFSKEEFQKILKEYGERKINKGK